MDEAIKNLREFRATVASQRAWAIGDQVRALSVNTFTNGTKVQFTKYFGGEKCYDYLAVKCDGHWYVTGTIGRKTSDEFEELLAESGGFESFEII